MSDLEKIQHDNGNQTSALHRRYAYNGSPQIAYKVCPKCHEKALAVLEQGYSFVLYLCDFCGAKIEEAV